jgi:hypothetical protein
MKEPQFVTDFRRVWPRIRHRLAGLRFNPLRDLAAARRAARIGRSMWGRHPELTRARGELAGVCAAVAGKASGGPAVRALPQFRHVAEREQRAAAVRHDLLRAETALYAVRRRLAAEREQAAERISAVCAEYGVLAAERRRAVDRKLDADDDREETAAGSEAQRLNDALLTKSAEIRAVRGEWRAAARALSRQETVLADRIEQFRDDLRSCERGLAGARSDLGLALVEQDRIGGLVSEKAAGRLQGMYRTLRELEGTQESCRREVVGMRWALVRVGSVAAVCLAVLVGTLVSRYRREPEAAAAEEERIETKREKKIREIKEERSVRRTRVRSLEELEALEEMEKNEGLAVE